jgi:uncharacterized membrane protein
MNILIESQRFFGVNAPLLLWVAAVGLLVAAAVATATLATCVHKLRNSAKKLSSALAKLPLPTLGHGLTLAEVEEVKQLFAGVHLYTRSWTKLQNKLVRRTEATADEYWLSVPATEILAPSTVTDVYLNRELYESFPGILTGLGLLCTFVAILVALLRVSIDKRTGGVRGIDLLIEGLSGKFISSIAALLAATIFTFFERHQFHKLDTPMT